MTERRFEFRLRWRLPEGVTAAPGSLDAMIGRFITVADHYSARLATYEIEDSGRTVILGLDVPEDMHKLLRRLPPPIAIGRVRP
jgi:hypothetical protein